MKSTNNQSPQPPTQPKSRDPQKVGRYLTLLFMLLALLIALGLQFCSQHYENEALKIKYAQEQARLDSLQQLAAQSTADSLEKWAEIQAELDSLRADSLHADSLLRDSLEKANQRNTAPPRSNFPADSIAQAQRQRRLDSLHRADSLQRVADSLQRIADSIAALRASDTIPPTGIILPPQGRYYEPISLRLHCDEPKCIGYFSLGDTSAVQTWTAPLAYNTTGTVWWQFADSVGNKSEWQATNYDMAADNRCPKNSYPVPVGGKTVCVDAYEYPNEAEALPRDMVNQAEAAQLCSAQGKYLCTLAEWQAACRGKDNLRYPYGNRYDQTRCATAQKQAERSGRKESCRSWWGMSDMSGNLWEWTATPYPQRPDFYMVAGGAWNTADGSSCSEVKFSFYPQNQYPFVGFRCCSEIN